jgi:2-haloacid dehalogenase
VDAKALIHIYDVNRRRTFWTPTPRLWGSHFSTPDHICDKHEHELEQVKLHQSFRTVAAHALRMAMEELGLSYAPADVELLTSSISRMPPFPEVAGALNELKAQGFKLCIISNTDDDIIAGNVAQIGGHIERVITAQRDQAYKPSSRIFECAHDALGIAKDGVVHICASPHLDLVAAREMTFRRIWIDGVTGALGDMAVDMTLAWTTLTLCPHTHSRNNSRK